MRLQQRGMRGPGILSVVASVAVALVLVAPAWAANIKTVRIFFEFNFTDNDLGLQVFFDAPAWKSLTITGPDGMILQIGAQGGLETLGLTELFFESAEPSPQEVLDRFEAGRYEFEITLVDGETILTGMAMLSHDLPAPVDNISVDPDDATISWHHPKTSELAGFQVILENVTIGAEVASFFLPASAEIVHVPPEVLAGPGNQFKGEVLAISKNGNKTIVEFPFPTQ